MKRAALMTVLALLCGLVLGSMVGLSLSSSNNSAAVSSSIPTVAYNQHTYSSAVPTEPPLDVNDNTLLLERASQVLEALKQEDYSALSQLVHPRRGVTLTPYSTVDHSCDNVLSQDQVAGLAEDTQLYTWGLAVGSGSPIRCTSKDYFARYVFNADYTEAPQVGIDTVLISGNALENVADAYPNGRFVEYHFPGIDPALEGFDWCSLKLVFEIWNNDWYLVGIIHGEWTS